MARTIIIVILALLGIFVHPFSPGTIDFIYRFFIFAAITYMVYLMFRSHQESEEADPIKTFDQPPIPKSDIDIKINKELKFISVYENDGRTEDFITSQFNIIQGILIAENGYILYKQNQNSFRILKMESKHLEPEATKSKTYPISGLIQILDSSDQIVLENSLNENTSLLEYYSQIEYKPGAFFGVPVDLYEDEKIFFAFDSAGTDQFNSDDRGLIENIRQSTRLFLINRLKGYSLLSSLRSKESLLDLAQNLNSSKTVSQAMSKLSEYVSGLFEATRLTISIKKQESDIGLIKIVVGQKNDQDVNFEFPLDQGLTGWVIAKNKPYLLEDMEKGEYFIPRYTKDERTNFGLRSFLGIPLHAGDKAYGAITFEHITPGKYTEADKHKVQQIAEIFSTTFQRQHS